MKRQQSIIDNYFRVKAKPDIGGISTQNIINKVHMENVKCPKKRSLSLQRKNTPNKSPKTTTTAVSSWSVLSKYDENSPQNSDLSLSGASDTTIIYSPPTSIKTPSKYGTPKSERKSDNKIFSPERNRRVFFKRSPKVVRNLTSELNKESFNEDKELNKACEGYNDTTQFFFKMIHKFLNNDSLKMLIDEKEQQLLSMCFQVIKPGMLLVCRLYWHQDRWQKWEKLCKVMSSYRQVDSVNLNQVVDSLVEYGFLMKADNQENKITFDELVHILKLDELKTIAKNLLNKTFKTKDETIEALRKFSKVTINISIFLKGSSSNNMSRLLKIMSEAAGNCFRLSELARRTLYKVYLLSFLGMDYKIIRDKNLELLLINDKINIETYPIDKCLKIDDASVVFRHKDDFDKYLTAHYIYEDYETRDTAKKCELIEQVYEMYKSISDEDVKSYKSLPAWLLRFTPAHKYISILSQGIPELKRLKSDAHYQLCLDILSSLIAQDTFRQHKKEFWYSEKALVLFLLRRFDEAAQILLDGFNSSMPTECKDVLRARAKKIANQKNITVTEELRQALLEHACDGDLLEKDLHAEHVFKNRVEISSSRGKVKFITKTEHGLIEQDAELCCITHYVEVKGEYTHGEHWEGKIVNTIFLLLFWDIIFHRLPGLKGIYLSHFQRYPLDMFTESFYENRKSLIEERLNDIENWSEEQLIEVMHMRYMSRPETDILGVTGIPWSTLRSVVACLGRAAAALCRPLAVNYRHSHSGFPDLTLWNEHTRKIKFVEVKTDTDRPSMKQLQWMHYLRKNNIDTEFCYIGTNTTRCKARGGITNKRDTLPNTSKETSVPNNIETLNTSLVIDIQSDDSSDFETSMNIGKRKSVTPKSVKKCPKPKKKAAPKRKSRKDLQKTDENVNKESIKVKEEMNEENNREKRKSACPISFEDESDEDLLQVPQEMLEVILVE